MGKSKSKIPPPREIEAMQHVLDPYRAAILSGRQNIILSKQPGFARMHDWFQIEDQRFIFITKQVGMSAGMARDILWAVHGYTSPEDFMDSMKATMGSFEPRRKLYLYVFAPSIECEIGDRTSVHVCKYLDQSFEIYRAESGAYMLYDCLHKISTRVYNCPGCRAVLEMVMHYEEITAPEKQDALE